MKNTSFNIRLTIFLIILTISSFFVITLADPKSILSLQIENNSLIREKTQLIKDNEEIAIKTQDYIESVDKVLNNYEILVKDLKDQIKDYEKLKRLNNFKFQIVVPFSISSKDKIPTVGIEGGILLFQKIIIMGGVEIPFNNPLLPKLGITVGYSF